MNLSENEANKAHQQLENVSSAEVHCTSSNTNVADDSKIAPTERQLKVRTINNIFLRTFDMHLIQTLTVFIFVACSINTYSYLFCYFFLF